MPTINLTDDEVRALTAICLEMPWKLANPILTKISQIPANAQLEQAMQPLSSRTNSDKKHERRISEQP